MAVPRPGFTPERAVSGPAELYRRPQTMWWRPFNVLPVYSVRIIIVCVYQQCTYIYNVSRRTVHVYYASRLNFIPAIYGVRIYPNVGVCVKLLRMPWSYTGELERSISHLNRHTQSPRMYKIILTRSNYTCAATVDSLSHITDDLLSL